MKTITSKYSDVRADFFDEKTQQYMIDAWLTDDPNEDGEIIAKVNIKTKKVEYLDEDAKTDVWAQEIIEEVLEGKTPKKEAANKWKFNKIFHHGRFWSKYSGILLNQDDKTDRINVFAWFTDQDDENGEIIAKINDSTHSVEYLDEDAKNDEYLSVLLRSYFMNPAGKLISDARLEELTINAIEWAINVSEQATHDILSSMGITSEELEIIGYDKENFPDMHKWVEE